MIDLRHFKEAMISYMVHSPYVKQILDYSQRLEAISNSYTRGFSSVAFVNMVDGR